MAERDRLLLRFQHEPCAGCWDSWKTRGQPKNHAHHGLVRRMKPIDHLLWHENNILALHHACHVPETEQLRFNSALILSVRHYTYHKEGPKALIRWVEDLPTKVRLAPPAALMRVATLWDLQSALECPYCGKHHVHYRHEFYANIPVPNNYSQAVVCWRCLAAFDPFTPSY